MARERTPTSPSVKHLVWASSLAAAIGAFAGCQTAPETVTSAPTTPPAVSETSAANGEQSELAKILAENAALLPSLARGDVSGVVPLGPPASPPASGRGVRGPVDGSGAVDPIPPLATIAATPEAAPAPPPAPVESPGEKRLRLVNELAGVLKETAAKSDDPFDLYAALASLEGFAPGTLPQPNTITSLSPREADLLTVWRDMHRAASEETGGELGRAAKLTNVVAAAGERMSAWQPLRISRAQLCARVEGFGVYTPLPGQKLLAGQLHRIIVYVELDHFGARGATTKDVPSAKDTSEGYVVELSQELSLFHDADGLLAWRKPEEVVTDYSRNRRRDFYMVQVIELPESLTVGAYRLKVTIKDRTTGAVAESILPIDVVADAALVRAQEQ